MSWALTADWFILLLSLLALMNFLRDKFHLILGATSLLGYTILLVLLFRDPICLILGVILLIIAEIDRLEHRIPDVFTKPALFALTIFFRDQLNLILIAWGWMSLMYLVTRFFPSAIGRGDIKLLGALLLINGYLQIQSHEKFLVDLLFLSSVLALPMAIATRIRSGKNPFAFGPAIAGAWIWLVGSNLG